MTKRIGLRAPTSHSSNALRIGTILRVKINGSKDASMMLSALVRRGREIYALALPHTKVGRVTSGHCELMRGPGRKGVRLGSFVDPGSVIGKRGQDFGFCAVQLDDLPLFKNEVGSAKQLSTMRGFSSNFWNSRSLKLRRVNDDAILEPPGSPRKNRGPSWTNKLGRVLGEIHDVEIDVAGDKVSYPYCGVVSRRGRGQLAAKSAIGAPLISKSGALSGIIVGRRRDNTLVLPIDQIAADEDLSFVTFGGDWPKVKISQRWKSG
ncbi:hypothetical protein [Bradyrhizobium vignae]|uniref:hypothetical protein n=1 Tax=Bradyrhizobium vignae TaxID=1549949 RepID=UPI00100A8053|nr:hypothetical protein [Bradyrhizobium vignae]RXG97181.1 hypothetical protein EAV90_22695 [Bradyrhizobium vignae]